MGFVNEVVSDKNIDKYQLPFDRGCGRYWTFDAERNIYLWGGKGGNPAYGQEIIGAFYLCIDGKKFRIELEPGEGSRNFFETPYCVAWSGIINISPAGLHDMESDDVVSILKEALIVYGRDGRTNSYTPDRVIRFDF